MPALAACRTVKSVRQHPSDPPHVPGALHGAPPQQPISEHGLPLQARKKPSGAGGAVLLLRRCLKALLSVLPKIRSHTLMEGTGDHLQLLVL